ncbi:hypothetical protein ACVWXU_001584 [Streptomyces sp. TE33382]
MRGIPAALDPTVTMQPEPRRVIRAATARDVWKTPVVFTAKVSAQSWSDSWAAGEVRSIPATFTRTSSGPRSLSAFATMSSTECRSVTSMAYAVTDGCVPASRSMPDAPRSVAATRAPSPANASVTAAPMPCPAPVTSTVRPSNSP